FEGHDERDREPGRRGVAQCRKAAPPRALVPRDDPPPEVRRRGHGRFGCERSEGRALRFELRLAHRALRKMAVDRIALPAVEEPEGVEAEVVRRMLRHGASSASVRRSWLIARRARLFTVPSGAPVRVAISDCVWPSDYASTRT